MTQAIQPPKIANSFREHPLDATGLRSSKTSGHATENMQQQVQAALHSKPADKVEISPAALSLATKPNVAAAPTAPPAKAPTPTDVATGKNVNQII